MADTRSTSDVYSVLVTDPVPATPLLADTRLTNERYSALVTEAVPPVPLLADTRFTNDVCASERAETRFPTLVNCAETALPVLNAALKVFEMAFRTLCRPFVLAVAEFGDDHVWIDTPERRFARLRAAALTILTAFEIALSAEVICAELAEIRLRPDKYSALVTDAAPAPRPLTVLESALCALVRLETVALTEVRSAETAAAATLTIDTALLIALSALTRPADSAATNTETSWLVTDPPPPTPLLADTRLTNERYSALVTEAPPAPSPLTVLERALWALLRFERTAFTDVTSAETTATAALMASSAEVTWPDNADRRFFALVRSALVAACAKETALMVFETRSTICSIVTLTVSFEPVLLTGISYVRPAVAAAESALIVASAISFLETLGRYRLWPRS